MERPNTLSTAQRVRIRGRRWTVQSLTGYEDCEAVHVTSCDRGARRTFLRPFDRVEPFEAPVRIRVAGRRRWAHRVAAALTSARPFGGLRAAVAARIDLLAYQLEPALAMLRHARLRILIADEVGLGKTVQAGIILSELTCQDAGFRAIVLCPAGLREQWHDELASRFTLEAVAAGASWLERSARELPADVNPWSLPGTYIVSLDLAKRPEVLRALEDVTWDLAVVDEAHVLGVATGRLAAAAAIGARSRRVVLMTATPPDGDPAQFSTLAEVGLASGEAPVTLFRRTRRDVGVDRRRRSILLPVRLSAAETRMHRLLERYTSLVWREAGARGDRAARLAVTVLRKRALSSAASLSLSVARRLAILGTTAAGGEEQLRLPLGGDEDPLDDRIADTIIGASGLADVALERTFLSQIAAAAREAARSESKIRRLRRLLGRVREPAIVFTEYRDTLTRMAGALASTAAPLMLHGGMTTRERSDVLRTFARAGGPLLATDAASEGLNLHERCRLIIHFELPWTPMRLEQRTGRVDRLGQRRRVHEVLLVARDTAERLVLAPLLRRARIAHAHGQRGANALDESAVARIVLEGTPLEETPEAPPHETMAIDLRTEAEAERERLLACRTFAATARSATHERDIAVFCDRHPAGVTSIVLECVLETGSGRVVHRDLAAVEVPVASPPSGASRREIRAWAADVLAQHQDDIVAAVRAGRAIEIERARSLAVFLSRMLAARERTLTAVVTSTAQALVQAGLFERRAIAAASARDAASDLSSRESTLRIRTLSEDADLRLRVGVIAVRGRR
jgi:superfamily II DNA or RNA helicase